MNGNCTTHRTLCFELLSYQL